MSDRDLAAGAKCLNSRKRPVQETVQSSPVVAEFSPPAQQSQANHFNLLRVVFASMVILSHAFELTDGNRGREPLTRLFGTISLGELAVDGFFILSGYLITKSWMTQPSWRDFLIKRIARIYPAFIVCSLVCGLLVAPLGSTSSHYFEKLNVVGFLSGILTLQRPAIPDTFQNLPNPLVNGAMWSISYEFQCYLLVLVMGVLGAIKRPRWWLVFFGTATLLFIASRLVHELPIGTHRISLEQPIFLLAVFFLAGSGCYVFGSHLKFNLAGLMLAVVGMVFSLSHSRLAAIGTATFGTYILFCTAFANSSLLDRLRPKNDVSYGIYLYGWPVQQGLLNVIPHLHPSVYCLLTLLISTGLGHVSWRLIERPAMTKSKWFLMKQSGERRTPSVA